MYGIHKVFLLLGGASAFICGYFLKPISDQNILSSILAFFGIIFGLSLNAVVAMSGSSFLKEQAKIIDSEAGGILMTNAQRIAVYLKLSLFLDLIAIVIILLCYVHCAGAVRAYLLKPLVCSVTCMAVISALLVTRIIFRFFNDECKK